MNEEKKFGFRKPNWDALKESLKGEGGCDGQCQGHVKRGNPSKNAIGGWWLERCSGRCARPVGHDGNHLCKHHYGTTPKRSDGHDPSYDGISYVEVDDG